MYTDPISDLLTRIRNASNANHTALSMPYSKIKENILKIMQEKGFIENFKKEKEGDRDILNIELKDTGKSLTLNRISKPGQRIYTKYSDLKPIKSGLGIVIISTPQGLMTNLEARKKHLGGEILCEIY